ncbi:hypothetical protein BC832DRAFT_542871 [Gaertneriomyces semiglobifer]|nr:hypothetical protein BC832DRAFT_542871 [Gaertneriomyces semiglobifer]
MSVRMAATVKIYSYIHMYDTGFAPNFTGDCLTLNTCKPRVRRSAKVGDYNIGLVSRAAKPPSQNKCVKHAFPRIDPDANHRATFVMKVTRKITMQAYDQNVEFACKKPCVDTTQQAFVGDNIYDFGTDPPRIREGFHTSRLDHRHDLNGDYTLISDPGNWWYWGKAAKEVPPNIVHKDKKDRGHRISRVALAKLEQWLQTFPDGKHGEPCSTFNVQEYRAMEHVYICLARTIYNLIDDLARKKLWEQGERISSILPDYQFSSTEMYHVSAVRTLALPRTLSTILHNSGHSRYSVPSEPFDAKRGSIRVCFYLACGGRQPAKGGRPHSNTMPREEKRKESCARIAKRETRMVRATRSNQSQLQRNVGKMTSKPPRPIPHKVEYWIGMWHTNEFSIIRAII